MEALDKEPRRHTVCGALCIWNCRTWRGKFEICVRADTTVYAVVLEMPTFTSDWRGRTAWSNCPQAPSGPCFADGVAQSPWSCLRAVYWHESITHPGSQGKSLRPSEVSLGMEDAQERWGIRAMALTSFYQSSPFHLFLNDIPLIVSFWKILILKFIRIVCLAL